MCLRDEFKAEVISAIGRSRGLGYTPTRFIQMMEDTHPVEIAKQLVVSGEFQHGIQELTRRDHQELTIEAIMLQERFAPLFTKGELEAAAWRLEKVPPA